MLSHLLLQLVLKTGCRAGIAASKVYSFSQCTRTFLLGDPNLQQARWHTLKTPVNSLLSPSEQLSPLGSVVEQWGLPRFPRGTPPTQPTFYSARVISGICPSMLHQGSQLRSPGQIPGPNTRQPELNPHFPFSCVVVLSLSGPVFPPEKWRSNYSHLIAD